MSRLQCPVHSGPAPIRGGEHLPQSEWPAYHNCYESAGHGGGKHRCGCGYEWSYLREIPALDGLRPAPYDKY